MANRVLVVDDDRALQVLLNVILTRAGFDVEFASSGTEAMQKLDGDNDGFKAVLLDLILPEVSGIEILDHLTLKKPSVLPRVIVLTSASHGILQNIDTSRVHSLIRKPFDIQDLIAQTAKCVSV